MNQNNQAESTLGATILILCSNLVCVLFFIIPFLVR
jgi:hypothetical protein